MNKLFSKIKFQNIAIAFGIAIFFIADRGLKIFAQNNGSETYFRLLGDWFLFRFTPNPYISFSLPVSGILLNITIILIIIGLIYYIFYLILNKKNLSLNHSDRKITLILLTIILFGAISNIQDRLIYGYVIDYLELKYFTVFNLADIMISGGTIILIIKTLKTKK
ncbi:MAG: signal peptidase II [Candidatus Falkowbacteria bacterium]|nr:signal peptidase II [Candidatus Falkowbacteria bacterium]